MLERLCSNKSLARGDATNSIVPWWFTTNFFRGKKLSGSVMDSKRPEIVSSHHIIGQKKSISERRKNGVNQSLSCAEIWIIQMDDVGIPLSDTSSCAALVAGNGFSRKSSPIEILLPSNQWFWCHRQHWNSQGSLHRSLNGSAIKYLAICCTIHVRPRRPGEVYDSSSAITIAQSIASIGQLLPCRVKPKTFFANIKISSIRSFWQDGQSLH